MKKCKICNRKHEEVNHWFLGFRTPLGWCFAEWDEELAKQEEVDGICSRRCLTIWVDRKAEEMSTPVRPEPVSVSYL